MSRPLAEMERSERLKADAATEPEQVLAQAHAFVEEWLVRSLPTREAPPTRLHNAMYGAVFPGGHRARPLLCRLIAEKYGHGDDEMVGRMSAALEFVHCASLVQDDLPCFDNAATRRGLPSCHVTHGEATAILVGDALLTLAFETLSNAPARKAAVGFRLMGLLTSAAGSAHGIIGGQALELEPHPVDVHHYHKQKTAALFRAAAAGGAICAGAEADVPRWARLGELMGCALQLRDDLDDVEACESDLGKPVGRDLSLGRPNAALSGGLENARAMRQAIIEGIAELLGPPTPETRALRMMVEEVTRPSVANRR